MSGVAWRSICVLSALVALGGTPVRGGALQSGAFRLAPLPQTEQMEWDLLGALNRERITRDLAPLRMSLTLVRLGRAQSNEMAGRNALSHESAAGSFSDRLESAGVSFAANAENIAQSGTLLADVIHRSFMESPDHRANILNPDFDEVGIGVVPGAATTYFVTEDFIKSVPQRTSEDIRSAVLQGLNAARTAKRLPAIVSVPDADVAAEALASDRAAGLPLTQPPALAGQTRTRILAGPDLDKLVSAIEEDDRDPSGAIGVGALFGRSDEYPGGAYFVCAIFVRIP
jgi:uncharacterized protein YkwD